MTTHWKQTIGALLTCFVVLATSSSHAADTNSLRYSATVKVDIAATDNIKGLVSSYLNRELRSLNDVEIVENDPDWIIYILAGELNTVGGNKNGVVISTVIVRPFNNQMLSTLFQPKFKNIGLTLASGLTSYPDHRLKVGATDDLQKLCKDIVADFDTKHLEESRKVYRQMKEKLQESK